MVRKTGPSVGVGKGWWGRDGCSEGAHTKVTVLGDGPVVPPEAGELETVKRS